jgi:hypothetical protein
MQRQKHSKIEGCRLLYAKYGLRDSYRCIMNATQWAAWVGACTGVVGLMWNIYTKLSAGPKLRVTAFAGMVLRPSPPGDPKFLSLTVRNIGTAPTTVTNVSFHTYGSWWKRFSRKEAIFSAVLNDYQGPSIPHPLAVGQQWSALMQQDSEFTALLTGDKPLYVAVYHSFAKQPAQVRIFQPST